MVKKDVAEALTKFLKSLSKAYKIDIKIPFEVSEREVQNIVKESQDALKNCILRTPRVMHGFKLRENDE